MLLADWHFGSRSHQTVDVTDTIHAIVEYKLAFWTISIAWNITSFVTIPALAADVRFAKVTLVAEVIMIITFSAP
jgi:hypothetical protein